MHRQFRNKSYLCTAKTGREGLCHQRTVILTGHRARPDFAKTGPLRACPPAEPCAVRNRPLLPFGCLFPLASPSQMVGCTADDTNKDKHKVKKNAAVR